MTLTLAPAPSMDTVIDHSRDRSATTALLFPGAGGQTAYDLNLVWSRAPELAARAAMEVGADPFERAQVGARFRQPAVYCASIAAWMNMGCPQPGFVAGYSTGEYAALAVAGVFSIDEGLRLVALRARLLQEAFENATSGGIIRVFGLSPHAVEALSRRHGLVMMADNCPGEVALGGESVALWAAETDAVEHGGTCMRLEVPRPTDPTALAAVAAKFEVALRDADIREPDPGVFSCTAAGPFDDVRARLVDGLTRPIEWRSTLLALRAAGAQQFVDVGPSGWMADLVRRTIPSAEIDSALAA